MVKITQNYLKSILAYDQSTGIFTWKVRKANWINIGDKAGRPDKDGYMRICINGNEYKSHKLAYLYIHGIYPKMIDHVNGIRDDNKIENIRIANISENNCNKAITGNNTSGYKGVNYHKKSKRWRATTKKNGKHIHIGYFNSPEEAYEAYKNVASELFGEFFRAA